MERTGKLSARQVEILQWIADSCPDGVMAESTYKVTAQALQGRGLVAVSKRGGVWQASVTEAGTYYLAHGRHPERESQTSAPPAGTPAKRRAAPRQLARIGDVPVTVEEFLSRLEAGQGEVRILDPAPGIRATWRRILHAARASTKLPEGWHLLHRGRDSGDLVIELRPGVHPSVQYTKPFIDRITIPESLQDPHPVVAYLRNHPWQLPASDANRVRALLMAQALIAELESHNLTAAHHDKASGFTIGEDRTQMTVTFGEETGARWTLRLIVQVAGPSRQDSKRWVDRQDWTVEDGLGTIAAYITAHVDAARQRHQGEARLRHERQHQQRQQEITEHNLVFLLEQVVGWEQAQAIRSHCHQLVQGGMSAGDPWLRLAHEQADLVDPLTSPPGLPPPPRPGTGRKLETVQPSPVAAHMSSGRELWHPNRRWWNR